jgi:homoserine kinase type II
MRRANAQFASDELAQVLSHYDIGVIAQISPLSGGSERAPKVVIVSEQGKFLLKRRPKVKDDVNHAVLAHSVQTHLAERGFPVPKLERTRDQNSTILQFNDHVYELFEFVTGLRYDGSVEAGTDSGRQLAKFHKHMSDFVWDWMPPDKSFHDSSMVRRHLKLAGAKRTGRPSTRVRQAAEVLMSLYNAAAVRVNELGFDSWPKQIVHGDWHPGNMLFASGKLIAVLDFDSVKPAPPATDLANGMLQFSIVAGRPNPANWPAYLDRSKLIQFLTGYRRVIKPSKHELASLPDLMIETMIAEAILPIAATGFFGSFSGLDFLKMIERKCEWIDKNRKKLLEAIAS